MRFRATAVVFKNGNLLLVRDRGAHEYSLPGGAIKKGEPTISAAVRELYEELDLSTIEAKRVRQCDFKGETNLHKVCLIEASGSPRLKGNELDEYIWWNMKSDIPLHYHVKHILSKLDHHESSPSTSS